MRPKSRPPSPASANGDSGPKAGDNFKLNVPPPDGASSDWGALAAGHGNRLMQLAQEAKRSSLAGPEQASAGLASQKINTPDSSRRHGVNLRASRFNDSDSDEWADPEGSFLAGLPGARGGLPGQLHVSKPAQRRKLRSISRQQVQPPHLLTHPNARKSMHSSCLPCVDAFSDPRTPPASCIHLSAMNFGRCAFKLECWLLEVWYNA